MDGYTLGHRRMAPLLEAAREFDIGENPAPVALYDPGTAGFDIWCTPEDHPGGLWSEVKMDAGAYSKPCAFVASVGWIWSEKKNPRVIGIRLTTVAYALQEARRIPFGEMQNRREDVAWAKRKIEWLWQASCCSGTMPRIRVVKE